MPALGQGSEENTAMSKNLSPPFSVLMGCASSLCWFFARVRDRADDPLRGALRSAGIPPPTLISPPSVSVLTRPQVVSAGVPIQMALGYGEMAPSTG